MDASARRLVAELPRPENILIISAHWEDAPITLSSTTGAPLVYDFWGFPGKYYEVGYDAPPATAVAAEAAALLGTPGHCVVRHESRGLDHVPPLFVALAPRTAPTASRVPVA